MTHLILGKEIFGDYVDKTLTPTKASERFCEAQAAATRPLT